MGFLVFLFLLVLGGRAGGGPPAGNLQVSRGQDLTDPRGYKYVIVYVPGGQAVFALYRPSGPGSQTGYIRSECWPTLQGAQGRITQLIALSFEDFTQPIIHPDSLGAGVQCGAAMGRKLLQEWG